MGPRLREDDVRSLWCYLLQTRLREQDRYCPVTIELVADALASPP